MILKRLIKNRSFLYGAMVLILAATMTACGPKEVEERAEVARPVKMITIGAAVSASTLRIPGSVFAAQSAELAFEVPGRMLERKVEEGQNVSTGDIVAALDDRDYVANRNRARAQRDTAKADYERYAEAFKSNAVTEQDVSRAKGHYDVTEADLNVAQKALDDCLLRAPFDGRIVVRLVDDFANVNAREPVLVLQDESSLELRVDVAERDWAQGDTSVSREQITKNLQPRVRIASLPGQEFPAYIKELSAAADPVSRTYSVTFGFASTDDGIVSPGMTGSVIVDRHSRNTARTTGIAVPAGAIVADEDGNAIAWVVDASTNRVSRQPVELGELTAGNVNILSGLANGDQVVVSGVNSVTENMLVRKLDD